MGCDKDDHISIKMSHVFTFFDVMLSIAMCQTASMAEQGTK